MPTLLSKKTSRRSRIIGAVSAAASVCLLITLTARPGASWDAGPNGKGGTKNCEHDVCSGGVHDGELVLDNKKTEAVKLRGNTHLWVVNNAIKLLDNGEGATPESKKIAHDLDAHNCRVAWETSLFDGDEMPMAETAGAFGTHFYNPTGRDFTGKPTEVQRYEGSTLLLVKSGKLKQALTTGNNLGNARDMAYGFLVQMEDDLRIKDTAALDARLTALSGDQIGCLDLGYALHYFTDMTQPMHSGSFAAVQKSATGSINPLAGRVLHGAFEYWVPVIQAKFPEKAGAPTTLAPTNLAMTIKMISRLPADDVFERTAHYFNGKGPALYELLTKKRPALLGTDECKIDAKSGDPLSYQGPCFAKEPVDPALVASVGAILDDAYVATASYLYTAMANGPGSEPKKK